MMLRVRDLALAPVALALRMLEAKDGVWPAWVTDGASYENKG